MSGRGAAAGPEPTGGPSAGLRREGETGAGAGPPLRTCCGRARPGRWLQGRPGLPGAAPAGEACGPLGCQTGARSVWHIHEMKNTQLTKKTDLDIDWPPGLTVNCISGRWGGAWGVPVTKSGSHTWAPVLLSVQTASGRRPGSCWQRFLCVWNVVPGAQSGKGVELFTKLFEHSESARSSKICTSDSVPGSLSILLSCVGVDWRVSGEEAERRVCALSS